jgi:hypothetical protein
MTIVLKRHNMETIFRDGEYMRRYCKIEANVYIWQMLKFLE